MTAANITAEHPVNNLAELGKLLGQTRQAKSMSVEAVAQVLHLQPRQIEAMERGDFSSFNSSAFVKGHLRAFAKLYGLDGDKLIGVCDALLPPPKEFVPFKIQASTKDLLGNAQSNKRIRILMPALVVFLVMGAALFKAQFLDFFGKLLVDSAEMHTQSDIAELAASGDPQQEVAIAVQAPDIVAPAPLPPQSYSEQSAALLNSPDQSVIAPVVATTDSILHIEFNDECWVQVKSKDGKVLHEKNHVNGDVLDMQVEAPVHLWLGRARGVNLSYNGTVVEVPVKPGSQSAQFVIGDEPFSGESE